MSVHAQSLFSPQACFERCSGVALLRGQMQLNPCKVYLHGLWVKTRNDEVINEFEPLGIPRPEVVTVITWGNLFLVVV